MEHYINGEDTVNPTSNIPTKGGKIRYLNKHHIWRRNRTKKVPHENSPHSAVVKGMDLIFGMRNTNIESYNNEKRRFETISNSWYTRPSSTQKNPSCSLDTENTDLPYVFLTIISH